MSASVFTAADVAKANAIATEAINILANGATGPSNFTWLATPSTTLPPPLGLPPASIPPGMTSTFVAIVLALLRVQEGSSGATPTLPAQLPVFANGAALPSAATWPGGMALVSSLGAAGQPVYSDGANWRRVDTNGTTIP